LRIIKLYRFDINDILYIVTEDRSLILILIDTNTDTELLVLIYK
jgi:DNA-binding LytR/AlgR family response regulator